MILTVTVPVYAKDFTDVPNTHWAYQHINNMSNDCIIGGYEDGTFKPANTISYAEFVTLLVNAYCQVSGVSAPQKGMFHPWYAPAFQVAADNKIMQANQFQNLEASPISRADMALLISNSLSATTLPSDPEAVNKSFADAVDILKLPESNQQAIAKVFQAGIISGDDKKKFNPNKTATRAEAATMINNSFNYFPKQSAQPVVTSASDSQVDINKLLGLVNNVRVKAGSKPLILNEKLTQRGEKHR